MLSPSHKDSCPIWRLTGVRNTKAIGTAPKPAVLQLIQRTSLTRGRLTITVDLCLTARRRSFLEFHPMDEPNKGALHGGLNPGGSCSLSHLDNVGENVRLRAWITDLANEDMDSAEGDPVPVLN